MCQIGRRIKQTNGGAGDEREEAAIGTVEVLV
jgi:hypothetical protein